MPSTSQVDNQIILFCHIFFWHKTLKGTVKAPTVDVFRLKILRGAKTAVFYPPKVEQPSLFIWE